MFSELSPPGWRSLMARWLPAASLGLLLQMAAGARAAPLAQALSGLDFLLGAWTCGDGKVAETGGSSKGASVMTGEAGGAVLLRRDHTELFDKSGKPAGNFEQIMTIYNEHGSIHADYFDGSHIIHYVSASIIPGRSVIFTTAFVPGAPAFRLIYEVSGRSLSVDFAMAPPGQTNFRPIAAGTLQRSG
jgi:hypothetical protein